MTAIQKELGEGAGGVGGGMGNSKNGTWLVAYCRHHQGVARCERQQQNRAVEVGMHEGGMPHKCSRKQ